MDFCGPLPSGDYMMVIVDEYSRYPIVEIVRSVSTSATIPVLDKVLSTFSFPSVIKTDNGSPFNSTIFKKYAENSGFIHRRITPCWPRANAQAEAFNKPLMKVIRAAHVERKNWKQELYKFLRQYRATPHPSTGHSPFQLLFNRKPQTKLPHVDLEPRGQVDSHVRQNDKLAKTKMKEYADMRNHAKPCEIQIGDTMLVKNDTKQDKLSTPFKLHPHKITARKGSMLTASNGEHTITRNSSRFKKIPSDISVNRKECKLPEECEFEEVDSPTSEMSDKNEQREESPKQERPKRIRKEPAYLKDNVK